MCVSTACKLRHHQEEQEVGGSRHTAEAAATSQQATATKSNCELAKQDNSAASCGKCAGLIQVNTGLPGGYISVSGGSRLVLSAQAQTSSNIANSEQVIKTAELQVMVRRFADFEPEYPMNNWFSIDSIKTGLLSTECIDYLGRDCTYMNLCIHMYIYIFTHTSIRNMDVYTSTYMYIQR